MKASSGKPSPEQSEMRRMGKYIPTPLLGSLKQKTEAEKGTVPSEIAREHLCRPDLHLGAITVRGKMAVGCSGARKDFLKSTAK